MAWLDLPAVQGTLKSLLQHHSSKASILHDIEWWYGLSLTTWLIQFLSEKRCYDLVHGLVEDWSGIRQHGKHLFVQEHTWYTAGVYSHYFHLGLSQGQHRSSTDQTLGWWKQCVKLDFWKQVPNCSGAVGEVSISQCKLPFLLTQMGKNNEHLYHLVAIYRNVQWECRLW